MTALFCLRTLVAGAAVLSLAGCLGSNSGTTSAAPAANGTGTTSGTSTSGPTTPTGGGTTSGSGGGNAAGGGTTTSGTGSLAAFNTKAYDYIFLQSTQTPITGTATYKGEVSMLTLANANDSAEALVGDLDMAVDFGAGVTNPVTATAGNFAGKVNGVDTTVMGTLSTANAIANDVNSVTANVSNLPGVGQVTLTGVTATLRGDVTDPTGQLAGSARMILNGNLKEANGAKLSGGHQTTIFPTDGSTSIATSGSIWADKQ